MNSKLAILAAFTAARWRGFRGVPRGKRPPSQLPIVTGRDFAERFEQYNALGLHLDEARAIAEKELAGGIPAYPGFSLGLSTGTTGEAGVFLTSEAERYRWIGSMLAKFLDLRQLAGAEIALLLKHNNRLYTDVGKTGRLRLHYFDITEPMSEWIGKLFTLAPQILVGPVSVLCAVAGRANFSPRIVLAGGEPLFPQDRELLRRAWGAEPRGIYQAKEGFLASGCRHGQLHLNQDLIFFEVQRFAGDPQRAVPVITDFTRTSQSFVRYRMDDVMRLATGTCPCGGPFRNIRDVEGRLGDIFLRPRASGDYVSYFPLDLNATILQHVEGDTPFALWQCDDDNFTLHIGDAPPELQSALREQLAAGCVRRSNLTIAPYDPPAPGQKRRRFRRLFDPYSEIITERLLLPPEEIG